MSTGEGAGYNVSTGVVPTASPGQARERMYFIHTKSSRAIAVTVLSCHEIIGGGALCHVMEYYVMTWSVIDCDVFECAL